MRNKRLIFFILFYMLIAILEFNILEAFLWAPFRGFGSVSLEYNHTGETAINIISGLPLLLCSGIFVAKMVSLYRKKEKLKTYLLYVLACISGIVLGTIIFWLDAYTIQFIWKAVGVNLVRIIEEAGWLSYPIP